MRLPTISAPANPTVFLALLPPPRVAVDQHPAPAERTRAAQVVLHPPYGRAFACRKQWAGQPAGRVGTSGYSRTPDIDTGARRGGHAFQVSWDLVGRTGSTDRPQREEGGGP
jgi:hypothetical protein